MILVTGATGHLGSHVVYALANAGKQVTGLYRDEAKKEKVKDTFGFYSDNGEQIFDRIKWVKGDINDHYFISILLQDVSHVIHTAGYVSFSDFNWRKLNRVNHTGTANLVNASLEAGVKKFCHVSTIATLGHPAHNGPITEELIWNEGKLASAYAKSKFKGEMEVWRAMYEGLNAVIVNPSVIIGPGMWDGPMGTVFKSIQHGLKFYPDGSTGFVDVRDVAAILVEFSFNEISGERYILNSENISHHTLLTMLSKYLNKKAPYLKITPFVSNAAVMLEKLRSLVAGSPPRITRQTMEIAQKDLLYSNKKLCSAINFEFIPVETSINQTIDLYLKRQLIEV